VDSEIVKAEHMQEKLEENSSVDFEDLLSPYKLAVEHWENGCFFCVV